MSAMTATREPTAWLSGSHLGELLPTATYCRREWQWLPAAPGDYADGRDGTLVILLTEDHKRGPKTTLFYYAVQVEWEAAADYGVRSFLLENEREPDEHGPFRCVVGGMVEVCGCEAGGFDRVRRLTTGCKHRDSLAALIAQGVM